MITMTDVNGKKFSINPRFVVSVAEMEVGRVLIYTSLESRVFLVEGEVDSLTDLFNREAK
jgi:uncharacterized protein YlzI (FlbEa/FlbD family)